MGKQPLSEKLLTHYADQIAEVYMREPGTAVSLDEFLSSLERECRYERDLRIRLGLSPEPEPKETT